MEKKFTLITIFAAALIAVFAGVDSVLAQKGDSVSKETKEVRRPEITPLLTENFEYATGQLTTVSGGTWVNFSGTGNFVQASSGSLSYTGYPFSGVGNKIDIISVGSSAEDAHRQFLTQGVGTTTYAAFLVNVTNTTGLAINTSTTGDYFAGFLPSSSTTALNARVSIRLGVMANTFNLGLRATSANAATNFSTTDLNIGTTYLVVLSYQIVAGNSNDVVNMWINPALGGSEPMPTLTQTTATASDTVDVARFFVRQGTTTTPNASIDGVRVGTSWADATTPTVPARAPLDFNGDGRTDYAIYRDSGGIRTWWIQHNGSATTQIAQWGLDTDNLAPADYDGDGREDFAVWRSGAPTVAAFYILQSSTSTLRTELFGQTGDDPKIVGDYDGDGKADVAVYRPGAQSIWYFRGSLNNPAGNITFLPWGVTDDVVAPGDYDGDGRFDVCIRRDADGPGGATNAIFILRRSSDLGAEWINWGLTDDAIVPGDYDGDGRRDFCVVRVAGGSGNFYILERDGGGTGASPIIFGTEATDFLAPGDYDGDGRADIAIWRESANPDQNFFYVRRSSDGGLTVFEWGQQNDLPVGEWNISGGN